MLLCLLWCVVHSSAECTAQFWLLWMFYMLAGCWRMPTLTLTTRAGSVRFRLPCGTAVGRHWGRSWSMKPAWCLCSCTLPRKFALQKRLDVRSVQKDSSADLIYMLIHWHMNLAYLAGSSVLFISLQTILDREKSKIVNFFKDGTSCCLPLDPAFRVKALDADVRESHRTLHPTVNLICTQFNNRSVFFFWFVTFRPARFTTPMLLLWGSHLSALTLWPSTSVSSARLVAQHSYKWILHEAHCLSFFWLLSWRGNQSSF